MNRIPWRDHFFLLLGCGVIYGMSDQSGLTLPAPMFSFQDKVAHVSIYAGLAWLACLSFRHVWTTQFKIILFSTVFCALYGVSDEWHQSFVVQRMPDLLDWYADLLGAMGMCLLLYVFFPQYLRQEKA